MNDARTAAPRFTFRLRLTLSLVFVCVLVAALAGAALWGIVSLREAARQAALNHRASRLANDVALQALQSRRFEKDFFLTAGNIAAQEGPLQRWHEANIALRGAIKAFEDSATGEPDRDQAARWRDAWASYTRGFGRVEIAISQGRIQDPQDAVATFAPFQETIQQMTDEAVRRAEARSGSAGQAFEGLERVGAQTLVAVSAIAAVALLVALLWSLLFPAWLARPIRALHDVAGRLAGGDLAVRTGLRRSDELGALAQSFDHMAATIERSQSELADQVVRADASRAAAEEAHRRIAEQLATIDTQRELISALHVPILPLTEAALVLPLVGTLDGERLRHAQERALQAVQERGARYLLLDITGVPLIDTQVAQGLMEVVQATQLLGCQVVLVGIRPEVAQSIVGLGLDFGAVAVQSTLQSGIAYTLRQMRHGPDGQNGRDARRN